MGNYTREEILAMAEEEDVEFIRLQFTDMFGTLKNIAITARELPRALDNQCVVYGSCLLYTSFLRRSVKKKALISAERENTV